MTTSETRLLLALVSLCSSHQDLTRCQTLSASALTIKWSRLHKTYWRQVIRSYVANKPDIKMDVDDKGNPISGISANELERCVSAVTGMTKARGEAALLMCVSKHGKFDVPTILAKSKAQVKDYGLELHNPDPDEQVDWNASLPRVSKKKLHVLEHSDMVCKAVECQSLLDRPVPVSLWELRFLALVLVDLLFD